MIRVHFKITGLLVLLCTASCRWEQLTPKVDCSLSPVQVTLLESAGTGCGASNGSFTVSASGGEGPYTYTALAGTNSDGSFENVAAGNYTVVATDAKGCTSEVSVTILNQNGVNLTDVVSSQAGCGNSNGTIEVSATGGAEPYLFSINGGATQSQNIFSDLDHGTHTVSVTDQLGCEVTESVEILSGVSYENTIKALIENNCAISGCHNGSRSPDLRTFSSIQSNASRIKARTGNKSMPQGRSLTQDQIDAIACWVDDGALQN